MSLKKKRRRPSAKKYTGKVIKEIVSPGSKSERSAVQLDTGDRKLLLRRKGGNPLNDEVMEELVGQSIKCQGFRKGSYLFLESWEAENNDE